MDVEQLKLERARRWYRHRLAVTRFREAWDTYMAALAGERRQMQIELDDINAQLREALDACS